MQATHPAADPPQFAAQHLGRVMRPVRPDERGPGQPAVGLLVVVLRQQVRPLVALELQPVLEQAQELVGGQELGAVLAGDVPAGTQGGQSVDGAGDAQVLVGAPVDHLQQLHRELHVAQSPAPEFELALAQGLRDVLLHPAAHGLDVVDEVLALGGRPHHRVDGGVVLLGQREVAGHGAGLEQRLELPRLGPTPVVGRVRLQRAHELARLALRPQRRVHLEECHRPDAHHLPRHSPRAGVSGFGHEDHVHVRDVVEFAGTALTHGHHGQAAGHRRIRVHGGHGHRQSRSQSRVRQIGQPPTHVGKRQDRLGVVDRRRHIVRRQQHHLIAIRRPQHRNRRATGDLRPVGAHVPQIRRLGRRRRPLDRLLRHRVDRPEHRRQDVLPRRQIQPQQRPPGGLGHQMVAERTRRPQQPEQAGPQSGLGAESRIQRRDPRLRSLPRGRARAVGFRGQGLPQPDECPQGEIRVRGTRERPEHRDGVVVVPSQVAQPLGRPVVEEAESAGTGYPGSRGVPAHDAASGHRLR